MGPLLIVKANSNQCRFPEMAPPPSLPGIKSSRMWKIDKPRKEVRSEIPEAARKTGTRSARADHIF